MSPGELFRSWFAEVWNAKNPDGIRKFTTDESLWHSVGLDGAPARGPAGFKPLFDTLVGAFPDIHFEVQNVIENGDFAAGHWVATMTHTGHGMGVPPTGKPVRIAGMAIVRCVDGKVVECWDQWDRLGLLTEIGAVAATV